MAARFYIIVLICIDRLHNLPLHFTDYNYTIFFVKAIDKCFCVWYNIGVSDTERYRSGHNGADSKSVCLNGHGGSNPPLSAN